MNERALRLLLINRFTYLMTFRVPLMTHYGSYEGSHITCLIIHTDDNGSALQGVGHSSVQKLQ